MKERRSDFNVYIKIIDGNKRTYVENPLSFKCNMIDFIKSN